jgi:hypothetical protein
MILDRVEDPKLAVLERPDGDRALSVPAEWLPDGVREGDEVVVEPFPEGGVRIEVNAEATARRRERMRSRRDSIGRGPSGDISL